MIKMTIHTTKSKQVMDITLQIQNEINKKGIEQGLCHIFILHTTAAITTADLDPGTDLDMLDAFNAMIPQLNFRHPHDPSHVPDHIWSSIIGPTLIVPIENGELTLGTWQRIVLIEFDGPRDRSLILSIKN